MKRNSGIIKMLGRKQKRSKISFRLGRQGGEVMSRIQRVPERGTSALLPASPDGGIARGETAMRSRLRGQDSDSLAEPMPPAKPRRGQVA